MPLLKREPEIWPPNLFGEPGGDAIEAAAARASAAVHRLPRPLLVGGSPREADRWWVAHTRSRQEKALARHLLHCEVPYYLPQREHKLRAGDRWRISHVPLFPGYVFFHGDLQDRLLALRSNVIARLIPAPAQGELQTQLRSLWLLQMTGEPLVAHPYIGPGDEVEILAGALRGYRGVVLRDKGRFRLVVSITLLRQSVATELDRDVLAPTALRKVG